MSDIEQYQPAAALAVRDHQAEAIARLSEWATSAQAAMVVAEQLSRSSFVPEAFRGKPGEATAAILAGLEVGLQPMAALRSFDIIQGQAAPRAITLRAILLAQGHEIELVESTATRCKMRGRRRGASAWQEVTWTMDRARQLGLASKQGWKNQPQAMLVARATSELARLVAADAILGVGYSAEEIADGAGAGVEVAAATVEPTAKPGTKRMSRKKAEPAPVAEEPVDAEIVDEDPNGCGTAECQRIQTRIDGLTQDDRQDLGSWWRDQGIPPLHSGDVTVDQAAAIHAAIDAYAPETRDPAEGRNRKMWAMVAEAWPTDSDEDRDELRRHLLAAITDGRATSSKQLDDHEWDALFAALEACADGSQELHLNSHGAWVLRTSPTRKATS